MLKKFGRHIYKSAYITADKRTVKSIKRKLQRNKIRHRVIKIFTRDLQGRQHIHHWDIYVHEKDYSRL